MDITRRFLGRTAMLDLEGRLTDGPAEVELAPLRNAICELTSNGCVDVAINLAGVTQLDARGLGELVCAFTIVRRHGGRFTLVSPTVRVAKMLAVTRIDTVLDVCDSKSEFHERFERLERLERSERSSWALSV
jgi:anti-anti-sigma factor